MGSQPALSGQDRLRALGLSQAVIAEAVEVTQQTVSGWLSRRSLPSRKKALLLQEKYGIPTPSWDLEPASQVAAADVPKRRKESARRPGTRRSTPSAKQHRAAS